MDLFFTSVLLLIGFFLVLILLFIQAKLWRFVLWNSVGLLGAILAMFLDLTGFQTKLSLFILSMILLAAIAADLFLTLQWWWVQKKRPETNDREWKRFLDKNSVFVFTKSQDFASSHGEDSSSLGVETAQSIQLWENGNRFLLKERFGEAVEQYKLSLKWLPTVAALNNMAAAYLLLGDPENALAACEKAIELEPDRKEIWANRGLAYEATRDHENALESFQKAIQCGEDDPILLVLAANEMRHLGKLDEALETYKEAIGLDPGYGEAKLNKGITLGLKGEYEEAIDELNDAAALTPRNSKVFFHLGNVFNKLNRNEEAVRAYRKALRLNPTMPEAWNNLGIAFTKLGNRKAAKKSYQKAIKINDKYYEAYLNLALALENEKETEAAAENFRKFLELAPESLSKHRAIAEKFLAQFEKSGGDQEGSPLSNPKETNLGKAIREKVDEGGDE